MPTAWSPLSRSPGRGGSSHHLATVSLVWIENTHMPAQGRPWTAAEVGAVVGAARARGLPVHCDGARIWNAAIALGVAPAELVAGCDTVMFCLSKGLGAPVGSVLCGSAAVIAEARAHRQRFGGGMRQAGIIAAGIVALETMVERLADDHARPAASPTRSPSGSPAPSIPRRCARTSCAARSAPCRSRRWSGSRAAGILAGTLDPSTFRFVVHKDVDDDGIDRACRAIAQL